MFPPGLLARLSKGAKANPAPLWALVVFGCGAIAIVVMLVMFEHHYGWPEWLTPEPLEHRNLTLERTE